MPGREIPLVTEEVYHIVNRGVASQPIFLNQKDYLRGLETIFYYQNQNIPLRYSFFLRLPVEQKTELLDNLKTKRKFLVEIIALCLMPNHVHLLLKQIQEKGISIFMSNFTNSYTRYFNTKRKRVGPLFQGKFKAVRVETDEQLIHLSRYIHLNPYSSYILKSLNELENYPYSSFPEYLDPKKSANFSKEIILNNFQSLTSYKKFVFDQADHQKRLQEIKHLILEE
ncbi:hypothetical protein COU95_03460 [Candidatus Shapirobacteria bacterium CG10_big_fil_rev_8_21_14_0_10_40_9]|uniref:Transposase IS200-like domain-containing protein n=1 Tax=Candidatus Shapirobacteria bacterium CG10_big_fil_rev_8_21_14_0_10_40_9 TaxID=1974888 RepID=A0A2M8L2Y1_9BACT|nr:MAG: hypothetical protein COU95_03460 [Candidatus Shapirobacteria bacterium CG10_big_fil_rev_8_21_14_0_10_40_9]